MHTYILNTGIHQSCKVLLSARLEAKSSGGPQYLIFVSDGIFQVLHSVLQCVVMCCSVLQCVAVCYSVFRCIHIYINMYTYITYTLIYICIYIHTYIYI